MGHVTAAIERLAAHQAALDLVHAEAAQRAAEQATAPPAAPDADPGGKGG